MPLSFRWRSVTRDQAREFIHKLQAGLTVQAAARESSTSVPGRVRATWKTYHALAAHDAEFWDALHLAFRGTAWLQFLPPRPATPGAP